MGCNNSLVYDRSEFTKLIQPQYMVLMQVLTINMLSAPASRLEENGELIRTLFAVA